MKGITVKLFCCVSVTVLSSTCGFVMEKEKDRSCTKAIKILGSLQRQIHDMRRAMEKMEQKFEATTRGLKEDVQQLAIQVSRQSQHLPTLSQGPGPQIQRSGEVAFSAVLTSTINGNQMIICNRVYVNVGNAYSPITGIFRAITAGMYVFSFGTECGNLDPTDVSLMKGNTVMVRGRWGPESWHSGGYMIILNVQAGEDVFIYLERGRLESTNTKPQTSFSGFLLTSA